MMEEQHELARNEICSIVSCSGCGAYHLNYRYIRLHLSRENLNSILEAIYVYEQREDLQAEDKPFKFAFGVAGITVYHTDYYLFKDAIESAVIQETTLPESFLHIPNNNNNGYCSN